MMCGEVGPGRRLTKNSSSAFWTEAHSAALLLRSPRLLVWYIPHTLGQPVTQPATFTHILPPTRPCFPPTSLLLVHLRTLCSTFVTEW